MKDERLAFNLNDERQKKYILKCAILNFPQLKTNANGF